jgi:hypothetical protein
MSRVGGDVVLAVAALACAGLFATAAAADASSDKSALIQDIRAYFGQCANLPASADPIQARKCENLRLGLLRRLDTSDLTVRELLGGVQTRGGLRPG